MTIREHPVHGILKALTEAEQHTYVRCSLHNHDRDALVEVRHHLAVLRELANDIIPWERELDAARIKRGDLRDPFAKPEEVHHADPE